MEGLELPVALVSVARTATGKLPWTGFWRPVQWVAPVPIFWVEDHG
jgi:hypothetical protein